jgi:glycosyltransferase involved in cell wall biosynthesis
MEKYRPDYVVNGETGYLVRSEGELSQKLGLLLTDQGSRLKMSVAAALHARKFDWDEVARNWERVFAEAAGKRRRKH